MNIGKRMSSMEDKVLIVEGTSDRKRVKQVLNQPVNVICTYGTLSETKLETLIYPSRIRMSTYLSMLMMQVKV